MKCDYKNSLQICIGDAVAVRVVTVHYNNQESDTLTLCDACANAVIHDAHRHGYEWRVRPV